MANLNFNAADHEPSQSFDPIPPAWYNAQITDSESKQARSGRGEYLKLEFTVIDGAYANRKVWVNLNLWNENQTAVEIAQRDLSAICHALNMPGVGDSIELHGKPLQIKVAVDQREGYEPQNVVKGYKAAGGGQMPLGAAPANPVQQAAKTVAHNAAPPWQQRAS